MIHVVVDVITSAHVLCRLYYFGFYDLECFGYAIEDLFAMVCYAF